MVSACEDCSKPTKQICIKQDCHTFFAYNAAIKTITSHRICNCLEYKEVKNDCYFKDDNHA